MNKMIEYIRCKFLDWKHIEYFDPKWDKRVEELYMFANSICGKRIMNIVDFGCGKMHLKNVISHEHLYLPLDYKKRTEFMLICDLNKHEFPCLMIDLAFFSGSFEYIRDTIWLVNHLKIHTKFVAISYVTIETMPNLNKRKSKMWKNHYSRTDFLKLFIRNGFTLIADKRTEDNYNFFIFQNSNNDEFCLDPLVF